MGKKESNPQPPRPTRRQDGRNVNPPPQPHTKPPPPPAPPKRR